MPRTKSSPSKKGVSARARLLAAVALVTVQSALAPIASALSIELKDVASDRIERQRAAADGRLPLPNTPDLLLLNQRLAAAGVKSGAPVLLRIFKESSELELWLERSGSYVLFATYPICHWSGTVGPKLREGDKQTPEGFYTITRSQIRHLGRWRSAINLGFPNAYDTANNRDGSYILMHGGCSSVGCFAMTNPVIGEVYGLVKAAIGNGQRHVPLHIFPFRMTDANLARHAESPWQSFWASLKRGYDIFEQSYRPPRVSVCKGEYLVEEAPPANEIQTELARASGKRRAASLNIHGAVRTRCPEPVVVTADKAQNGPNKLVGSR